MTVRSKIVHALGGWLVLAAMALGLGGCATNPVSGQEDFVLLSQSQELAIGRQENPKVIKEFGKYDNASLQAYINEVGQRLARHSHRPDLNYHFTLLDSDDVNAFALPGGYIYITRGLLAYLNSEAELAAVLGHEIGHVTARHSVRQISAAQAANLGYSLGAILVPELQQAGAQDLFNVLSTAWIRGYGREHELEADRLGAEYLARVGYDPHAMIEVIKVLKHQEQFAVQVAREEHRQPQVYHGVFATHPDNDTRLQQVVGEANRLKGGQITRGNNHLGFLHQLQGLTYGPSARQGIVRGNHFYHRELDFGLDLPAGWQVDNLPDALIVSAPGEVAALQVTVDELKGQSPLQYLLKRFGVDHISEGRPLDVGHLPGYTGIVPLRTRYGTRQSRIAALFYHQRAYLFIGISQKAADRARFDGPFLDTFRSFHALSAAEQAKAEPLRIHLLTVTAQSRYETLARHSALPAHAAAILRLLNNDYPAGEPRPGELLKVVE